MAKTQLNEMLSLINRMDNPQTGRQTLVNEGLESGAIKEIYEYDEIKKYSSEVWDIMQKSYEKIGGFLTYKTIEELIAKTSLLIACFKEGKMIVGAIYRDNLGGQKLVGCGTLNGSDEEKGILKEIIRKDIEKYEQWHWCEVSYPLEKWFKELNGNPIPVEIVPYILHKEVEVMDDGVHFKRVINGILCTKAIYGFKDEETFNEVMKQINDYNGFKEMINNLPKLNEQLMKFKNDADDTISTAMEIIIQIDNLLEEGYREITPTMYEHLKWAVNTLKLSKRGDNRILNMIRSGEYTLKTITVLKCNSFSDAENEIIKPAI